MIQSDDISELRELETELEQDLNSQLHTVLDKTESESALSSINTTLKGLLELQEKQAAGSSSQYFGTSMLGKHSDENHMTINSIRDVTKSLKQLADNHFDRAAKESANVLVKNLNSIHNSDEQRLNILRKYIDENKTNPEILASIKHSFMNTQYERYVKDNIDVGLQHAEENTHEKVFGVGAHTNIHELKKDFEQVSNLESRRYNKIYKHQIKENQQLSRGHARPRKIPFNKELNTNIKTAIFNESNKIGKLRDPVLLNYLNMLESFTQKGSRISETMLQSTKNKLVKYNQKIANTIFRGKVLRGVESFGAKIQKFNESKTRETAAAIKTGEYGPLGFIYKGRNNVDQVHTLRNAKP